jgi:Raf kinase inhibitor-like YbhB/YbcL family protein
MRLTSSSACLNEASAVGFRHEMQKSSRRRGNMSRDGLLGITTLLLLFAFWYPSPRMAAESGETKPQGARAMSFAIRTTAFSEGGAIPKKYTCDGGDVSPGLTWTNAPAGTQSLALIADDPDAPVGTWTHWILWNIPPEATALPEGVPKNDNLSDGTRQGKNDFKRIGYGGPCPPPGKPHRYFFKLYALGTKLDVKAGANRNELERAMQGHVLSQAELMGTYGR